MVCPDEVTLDLWLANALPADEAAVVAAHVRTCATCAVAEQTARVLDGELRAALALDAGELAFLADLRLAENWQTNPVSAGQGAVWGWQAGPGPVASLWGGQVGPAPVASGWGWIALAGAVAGFAAWSVAAPMLGAAVAAANQVGVGMVLLYAALGVVLGLGQALLDLTRNPALGLTQPLLALFALALLFWPRQFIPHRSTPS